MSYLCYRFQIFARQTFLPNRYLLKHIYVLISGLFVAILKSNIEFLLFRKDIIEMESFPFPNYTHCKKKLTIKSEYNVCVKVNKKESVTL